MLLSSSAAGADGSEGFVLNGIHPGGGSGASVSGAGDINGDGIDDLIIQTPGGEKSYVVFGRATGFPPVFEQSSLLPWV